MSDRDFYARKLGITFRDFQHTCFDLVDRSAPKSFRLCLYYKTGAGKSITSLVSIALLGYVKALVIAPPSTTGDWEALGASLGVNVQVMSHAKFRAKDTKLSKTVPVIADEFHLFGRNTSVGWKKLDRLAQGLEAPMILCSATPNYHDAERCYCVQKILDPSSVKGGFLEFLYRHCVTSENPFGRTPNVIGFRNFANAEEYLKALPNVLHVPDDVQYTVNPVNLPVLQDDLLEDYGLNLRKNRIVASDMEKRWARLFYVYLDERGRLRNEILYELEALLNDPHGKVLLFCDSSVIAEATHQALVRNGYGSELLTGNTSSREKQAILDSFRSEDEGSPNILVGTATLATGTDGLDRLTHTLIIVNDTTDDAKRRQLIGRILPRGLRSYTTKYIIKLEPS